MAEYFNGWYADMIAAPVKDEIQQRHLGLPPHLLSTSLLGWEGIAEAVDFSAEAVRQAREQARRLGVTADFRVGDLAATGLDTGSARAVLCVDAIQFAPQPEAAFGEIRRVLGAGGRAVLTNWEAHERNDERIPARLRRVDLRAGLTAAGFADVEVGDRPSWRAQERAMWEEAAVLDPGDDPALRSFHDEGVRSLVMFDLVNRVIATATAP
jgi:SAM-dependent methyltransferase